MADQLQCQIEVLDQNDGVVFWFRLMVEQVIQQITRTPVVFPIPSINKTSTAQPVAYALDFGMMNEQITIKGVSKDHESSSYRPAKEVIANIARTGWKGVTVSTSGGQIVVKGGVRLYMHEGAGQGTYRYQGVIQSFQATRQGGQLWWEWSLVLQVTRWPLDPQPNLPSLSE